MRGWIKDTEGRLSRLKMVAANRQFSPLKPRRWPVPYLIPQLMLMAPPKKLITLTSLHASSRIACSTPRCAG
jgi:hypothetical protein